MEKPEQPATLVQYRCWAITERILWVGSLFALLFPAIPLLRDTDQLTTSGLTVFFAFISTFAVGIVWILEGRTKRAREPLALHRRARYVLTLAAIVVFLNALLWYLIVNSRPNIGVISNFAFALMTGSPSSSGPWDTTQTVLMSVIPPASAGVFILYRRWGRPHKWCLRSLILISAVPWLLVLLIIAIFVIARPFI